MTSPDLTETNIDKLAELFPSVVTETLDVDGSAKRAIDFDLLRQELSDYVVEGPQERYQLDWPGKRAAAFAANAPIAKTLRPVREESLNFDTTKNLFIEGDNLDALKLLQESYLGKVKLIYIDPPYNTGNDFVYKDDFAESMEKYLARSGQADDSGVRLVANTESNGRFHSDWLSMMYPRLKLARNLLTSDGVLFLSADDHEVANLRRLCDEIFGEGNFQADISWQKRYTRSNNTQDFTTVVEHILVYSRSNEFQVNLLPRTDEADGRYSNPDNDPRGPWKGASFLNPATPEQRPNLCYPIINPNTGNVASPTTNAWRRSKEEFDRLREEGLLYWGADGTSAVPSIKMFLSEARGLTPVNFWEHTYAGNTDDGTRDVASLFNAKLFDNPKPVKLIKRILEHATGLDSLILDFFGGSGTTAEAVLAKNAEDGGARRFILVQIDEIPHPKSEAAKTGFQTIAAIARERIRRAGHKVLENGGLISGDLDVGFRALRIDTTNMADVLRSPDEADQFALDELESSIKPHRSGEDLLFQVLLDWGLDLTMPIAVEQIGGHELFVVEDGALIACFDSEVSPELVRTIAKREPLRAVFRDAGFASDDARINAEQIFREVSPSTDVKAI
ncbi:site-specific DNA-methyltransferase [Rhodococcus ruber]|uniref:site-specific DNA-methyltransferase n=1 Tax=Rhodococcus ruber TaxID=1830 RepID=UPI00387DD465